jgi:hypothetical protein
MCVNFRVREGCRRLQQIFEKQTGSRRELRIYFTFFETQRLKRSRECATGANCESDKLECLFQTDKPKTHTHHNRAYKKRVHCATDAEHGLALIFNTRSHSHFCIPAAATAKIYKQNKTQIFQTDKKMIFTTRARTQ